jgi:hypothetical protein
MSEAPLESDTLEAWLRAPASRCGHLRRDHRGAAPRPRAALVREHYATFVAHTEATYAAPLPRYVIDAFERYLACGDFSQGFVRCHCDACNHDVLVPFSCKQRASARAAARGVCATRPRTSPIADVSATERTAIYMVRGLPLRRFLMISPG